MDIDGITNVLLKSIETEILKLITLIINQSLETGMFPDAFKTSKVTQLYKKGDKTNLNNYRPISILSTIYKVFERVIYITIYDCITISVKITYYVNSNTVSVQNILLNLQLLNCWTI